MSSITFGGVSSECVGVRVERYPALNRPARKYDRYTVPGRNGDIIEMQYAWSNYIQAYSIFVGEREWGAAPGAAITLGEWLYKDGYQILEDSYESDVFRKAIYVGALDIDNVLSQFGRASIEFECMPQRFYWCGQNVVTMTESGGLKNPSTFTARPRIVVHGTGSGTISAGGNTLLISSIEDGMIIDSENQDCYDENSANLNGLVSGDFPVLPSGDVTVGIAGGITSIEITPNWWTL